MHSESNFSFIAARAKAIVLMLFFFTAGFNALAQAPANDDPCSATPLTVNAVCNFTTSTNANATASVGVPAPGCAGYMGGDVWFTVVVPAGGSITINTQTGVMLDGGMAIYSGTCNALTLIECDDDDSPNGAMPLITRNGLTPGSTIWVRVWEFGNNNNGTFGICATPPPAAPANDDPCNAIAIVPGAVCNYTTYSNALATGTTGVPAPGCANYSGGDVWFSVVVPAGGTLLFDTQAGVMTDGGMAIYTGSCSALTLIECDDDDSPNGLMPAITRSGLTPGSTVWVRVWEYGNDNNGTFGLCIALPPPPPVNDDPCAAITLTVNPTCTFTNYTNAGATPTTGVPAPGCADYQGGDVWFTVVVPAGGAISVDTREGVMTDGGMALYSGTCNALTLLTCDADGSANGNMPKIVAAGLTPGDTIRIRVWESGNNQNGTFGICVSIPPPPPANDNPCTATPLTAAATCTYATYTTVAATSTTGVPAPGCANYAGGDVWFSIVVPAGGALTIDTRTGVITDGGMALYSGACTALTLLACDDDGSPNGAMPKITTSGLTPGSTVYVRFWEYGNDNPGTFGICVTIPPPPPVNDNPCGAITLTANETCTYATYTTEAATGTVGVPAPGCAGYSGGDVWFKVVVPCTGSLLIDTEDGEIVDGGMALYSGTSCTALTLLACDDDGSGNGAMPQIVRTGLTPGSTVWIRVWEYGNDNPGTFGICVKIPPPPGPGGSCSTALAFCSSNVYSFPNTTGQPSLGGNGIYGCLNTTPNPTWYYMQVQTPGNITIGITQVDANGDELDVDFALWGPFTTLAGSCGGLTAANNISCSYSNSYTETAQINGALAGQFYIMLLTNYSDDPGTITFQQTGGNGSTNCNLVCTITAGNSGPVCPRGLINLTASSVPNGVYSWTGPNCFASNQQNPTGVQVPTTPGTYVYTVSVTGPNGVSCVSTTLVTVLAGPALGADSTITRCGGSSVNLTTLYTTTGTTTSWTIGGVAVPNPAAVTLAGIYQLVAANPNGCTDTALITLKLDTVRAVATATNANCTTTGLITVSDTTGIRPFTFNINTNPGVFQSAGVFSVAPGNYSITVKDSLGCTLVLPVVVGVTNNLVINGRADTTICLGGSAILTTSGNGTSYSWSPTTGLSNPSIASPVATPLVTTQYVVTATLGTCTKSDTVVVRVESSITVNAGPDVTILNGDATFFNASTSGTPVTSILWTPGTALSATNVLNPRANPSATTQYTITVENALGCTATDGLLVTVIKNCIQVKNAFTPNGDGNNDLWQVFDDFGCLRNVTVHIYNRYGSKVYESRDYRNQWDGTYQGKPVPDATYYAVIDFTLITGRVFTVKSDVTILR